MLLFNTIYFFISELLNFSNEDMGLNFFKSIIASY